MEVKGAIRLKEESYQARLAHGSEAADGYWKAKQNAAQTMSMTMDQGFCQPQYKQ